MKWVNDKIAALGEKMHIQEPKAQFRLTFFFDIVLLAFFFYIVFQFRESFLLSINSPLLLLFEVGDNLLSFCINASLIAASCIATATKATLDYAYASWDLNHKENGDELVSTKVEKTD